MSLDPNRFYVSPALDSAAGFGTGNAGTGLCGHIVYDGVRYWYSFSYTNGNVYRWDGNQGQNGFTAYPGGWAKSTAARTATGEVGTIGFFHIAINRATKKLYLSGAGLGSQSNHGYCVEQDISNPATFATNGDACTVFDPSTLADYAVTSGVLVDESTGIQYYIPTGLGHPVGTNNACGGLFVWDGSAGNYNSIGHWDNQDLAAVNASLVGFQYGAIVPGVALVCAPCFNGVSRSGVIVAYNIPKGKAEIHQLGNYKVLNLQGINTNLKGFTGACASNTAYYMCGFQLNEVPTYSTFCVKWDATGGFTNFNNTAFWKYFDTSNIATLNVSPLAGQDAVRDDEGRVYFVGNVSPNIAVYTEPGDFSNSANWDGIDTSSLSGLASNTAAFGGGAKGYITDSTTGQRVEAIVFSGYGYSGSGASHNTWLMYTPPPNINIWTPSAKIIVM